MSGIQEQRGLFHLKLRAFPDPEKEPHVFDAPSRETFFHGSRSRIDQQRERRHQVQCSHDQEGHLEPYPPRDTQRDESKQTIRGATTFS